MVLLSLLYFNKSLPTLFNVEFFSGILLIWIMNTITVVLKNYLLNFSEYSVKLGMTSKSLLSKYQNTDKWIKFIVGKTEEVIEFPVIKEYDLKDMDIIIKDYPNDRYELPEYVKGSFEKLMTAHSTSKIYNQLAIRVKNWYLENGQLVIETCRTTYFDSLVTNRSMDYELSPSLTIREVEQFGPFFPDLKDSTLSNHLGFNGFIETSDNYFLFIKRGGHNSIGKYTFGNSVGASLKAKYALIDGELTLEGIRTAIINEIQDEVKINKDELEDFSLSKNLVAAYRDVLEGGKPQLLFYAKTVLGKNIVEKRLGIDWSKKSRSVEEMTIQDGQNCYWIKRSELANLIIKPDMLEHYVTNTDKVVKLPMLPSASAATVMLIEYLNQ